MKREIHFLENGIKMKILNSSPLKTHSNLEIKKMFNCIGTILKNFIS